MESFGLRPRSHLLACQCTNAAERLEIFYAADDEAVFLKLPPIPEGQVETMGGVDMPAKFRAPDVHAASSRIVQHARRSVLPKKLRDV
jgi:hypothetical protein